MAKKTENVENVEAPVEEKKEKAKKVEIIRGRMPIALVALIKAESKEHSNSALAAKYRTTVGKIDDIRGNRNFGYVGTDFKPTEEQAKAAAERINQLNPEYVDVTMQALENMGIATDEEAAEFIAQRKAARKTKTVIEAKSEGSLDEEVETVDEGELLD